MSERVQDCIVRLRRRDPTLQCIYLHDMRLADAKLDELLDCLLVCPNFIISILLSDNQLTDETGVKLARYVAASTTIKTLHLCANRLGEATYLALAVALRVNSSLKSVYLAGNQAVDESCIDAAFTWAMYINPNLRTKLKWYLYSYSNRYKWLQVAARQQNHPTLQKILINRLQSTSIRSIRR